jgi:ParB family chromosome partitioning protein
MTQTTETTAPDYAGVEFAHVDPRTLVIEANMRADVALTPDFVGSIKDHGVLTPIVVHRTEDGTLRVRAGQRRTLAAIEAGRETIPAHIVDADDDQARRIIEQWAENDHRAAMRDADRTAATQQLALLGLTAGQIARRTRTKKERVEQALAVGGSKVAVATQAKYDLTLDQAATIADFDGDKEAVKALTVAAVKEPDQFEHVAQRLRDQRAEAEAVAAARQTLADEGTAEVEPIGYEDRKAKRLDNLIVSAEDRTTLTVENHRQCPGHAAYVVAGWRGVEVQYVCTDYRTHGHVDRYASGPQRPAGPLNDEEKAARREVIENNKAWRSAETVRRDWLQTFAQRKTAPKDAAAFIARAITTQTTTLDKAATQKGHDLAATWLGVATPSGLDDRRAITDLIERSTQARAQHIALVLVLGALEGRTGTHTWRHNGSEADYLGALESWGYSLSEVEQIARGATTEPGE